MIQKILESIPKLCQGEAGGRLWEWTLDTQILDLLVGSNGVLSYNTDPGQMEIVQNILHIALVY